MDSCRWADNQDNVSECFLATQGMKSKSQSDHMTSAGSPVLGACFGEYPLDVVPRAVQAEGVDHILKVEMTRGPGNRPLKEDVWALGTVLGNLDKSQMKMRASWGVLWVSGPLCCGAQQIPSPVLRILLAL